MDYFGLFRVRTVLPNHYSCFTMHTIRPVFWKHKKNKDGLFPLMIAVTIDRKVTYFKTTFRLKLNQWDGQIINYTNSKLANATLRQQIAAIEKELLERSFNGEKVTAQTLKHPQNRLLKNFALEIKGNGKHNAKEINRIEEFRPGVNLSEIDVAFLRKYEAFERARGMSHNTVNTTFKWLRRLVKQARKEKLISVDPFEEYLFPKYVQTDRTYLVDADKESLLKLMKPDYPFYNTLCYYLFACYTGLRHQDWSRISPDRIEDGMLRLRATKNKQLVVMPIGPTLQRILDIVLTLPRPYTMEACNRELKLIAKDAGINKNLTGHSARHSFAYMCAKNRIPKSVTAELMGISTRVIEVYYKLSGLDIAEQAAVLKSI